jgi:hypothetical protein
MSFPFVEGDLCFDFDARWAPILAWDRHPAYRRGINEIDGSSAVDIVGVCGGRTLYFIEVKDYRVHKRTKPIDPRRELDSKVRNTVAGLLGACRREEHMGECGPFVDAIRDVAVELKILFWCETPRAPRCPETVANKRARVGALLNMRDGVRYVKWLNARVLSTQRAEDYQSSVPGLVVTSLPRERRRRAEEILEVLRHRGVDVSEEARQRIESCLSLPDLERWLEQSKVVASAVELFVGRK